MRVCGKNVFNELNIKTIRKVYIADNFKEKNEVSIALLGLDDPGFICPSPNSLQKLCEQTNKKLNKIKYVMLIWIQNQWML